MPNQNTPPKKEQSTEKMKILQPTSRLNPYLRPAKKTTR
jgi:hypothetical protein